MFQVFCILRSLSPYFRLPHLFFLVGGKIGFIKIEFQVAVTFHISSPPAQLTSVMLFFSHVGSPSRTFSVQNLSSVVLVVLSRNSIRYLIPFPPDSTMSLWILAIISDSPSKASEPNAATR